MYKLGLKYISYIVIFFLLSQAIDTIEVDSEIAIVVLGLVLIIVNIIIKPLLLIVTFPLSMITFGLFSLVVNTWTIMFADFLVPGFEMGSFINSFIAALLILIANHLLKSNKRQYQSNK